MILPDESLPFDEPWQAEVFALTVHLNERGVFTWRDWGVRFGVGLAGVGSGKPIEGGGDYYQVWLNCLLEFLSDLGHIKPDEVALMKERWAEAYQTTPHGQPVHLSSAKKA
jgi:nitrile hydratase accessory protein